MLGAGGHARVVADIGRRSGYAIVALVDESGLTVGTTLGGLQVLGDLEDAPDGPIALGIGDCRARLGRYRSLVAAGRELVTLVHPHAALDTSVRLGAGTVVMAGVVVNADATVGEAVVLNTSCSVDHDSRIGDGAHVAPGCHLAGGVTVGEGAFLGIGCAVVPGRRLGAWCVCGAGSVVVRDVPPATTVKGVPAG